MNGVQFPTGFRLERLRREHPRHRFHSGQSMVDDWLATKAFQQGVKQLSVTRVLLDEAELIAGYYTLATAQVNFRELPAEISKRLPQRMLPVAVLAWLGVDSEHQGKGLGGLLVAQALRDCWEAGKTFPFVAVILDCLDSSTKGFYQRWDFAELPSDPMRLFLTAKRLDAMMSE